MIPDQPRAGGGRPAFTIVGPSDLPADLAAPGEDGFLPAVIQFTVSFSDLATVAFLYGAKSTVYRLFLSQWSNGRLEEAAVAALHDDGGSSSRCRLVRLLVQGSVRTTTVGIVDAW